MFRLTRIIQAQVRIGVAGGSHAGSIGYCRLRKGSNSICAAPGNGPSQVRRWTAAALVGGVALASLSACATAQDYDSRNLSADLRRNACFSHGLAASDPVDHQLAECLLNADAAGPGPSVAVTSR